MADISKISITSGTYSIKDTSALASVSVLNSSLIFTRRNNSTFSVNLPNKDEKVKVSTSTTSARFPLMAVATSSVTSGNTYEAIYDSGIVIDPHLHSVAEGISTTASGYYSHAEGQGTTASATASHAEGYNTQATKLYSHAEGFENTADGLYSHAEGAYNTVSAPSAHAEGGGNTASGLMSHVEGGNNIASEFWSHAEGHNTRSSASASHAEGMDTAASGTASHAEGVYTITNNEAEHAEGKYNYSHNSNDAYTIHSIGIGTGTEENNRKNALEVLDDGSTYLIGVGNYDGSILTNASTLQEVINGTIKNLEDDEYVISSAITEMANTLGMDENLLVEWSTASGIPATYSYKDAIEAGAGSLSNLGEAAFKDVDTVVTTTSRNLPDSSAVAAYVAANAKDEKQTVTATTSGTFYLSGVGTTSNTPTVGVADATIKVVNRVLTVTTASITKITSTTISTTNITATNSTVSGTATISTAKINNLLATTSTLTNATITNATVSNASITKINGVIVGSTPKFTDEKQNITLGTTSKAYITGVTTTPTGTAQALTGIADTSVFLTTVSGQMQVDSFKVTDNVSMTYDSVNGCLSIVVN